MELPITEKELDYIIKLLANKDNKQLYSKLWSFKINRKTKKEEN